MLVIRKGLFETNSSSIHSVCISKDGKVELPEVVHFKHGTSGCNHSGDYILTLEDKVSYLFEVLKDAITRGGQENVDSVDWARRILEDWGIKVIVDYEGFGNFDCRYGNENFLRAITDNPELMKRFLFCKESYGKIRFDSDYQYCPHDPNVMIAYDVDRDKFEVIVS